MTGAQLEMDIQDFEIWQAERLLDDLIRLRAGNAAVAYALMKDGGISNGSLSGQNELGVNWAATGYPPEGILRD